MFHLAFRQTLGPCLLLLSVGVSAGCSLLGFGDPEPVQVESSQPPVANDQPAAAPQDPFPTAVAAAPASTPAAPPASTTGQPMTLEEMELRQAKLFARIDELESKLATQNQKLEVMERSLLTGLAPTDPVATHPATEKPALEVVKAPEPATPVVVPAVKPDEAELQKRQAVAAEHFKNGRYGKAIVDYTAIGRDFPKADGGAHKYWLGRSWVGLRDYQNARQQFSEFLAEYPSNPLVPRAKLELARSEARLGKKETAVKLLRDLIQQHPSEDAAEMAKMELGNMQRTL